MCNAGRQRDLYRWRAHRDRIRAHRGFRHFRRTRTRPCRGSQIRQEVRQSPVRTDPDCRRQDRTDGHRHSQIRRLCRIRRHNGRIQRCGNRNRNGRRKRHPLWCRHFEKERCRHRRGRSSKASHITDFNRLQDLGKFRFCQCIRQRRHALHYRHTRLQASHQRRH